MIIASEAKYLVCRKLWIITALTLSLLSVGSTEPVHAGAKTVIELYTSQGCSSCPPADRLAAQYAKDPDIVMLTLPVTYWDYLGWKDTFAKEAFTKRQYNYATSRGEHSVYTPQVVINGNEHAVGSDGEAIAELRKNNQLPVDISIALAGEQFRISVSNHPVFDKAFIWMVLFKQSGTVQIARGENRSKTVEYSNIVRDISKVGEWDGRDIIMTVDRPDLIGNDSDGFAVILQTKRGELPSKILGASKWIGASG